MGTCTLNCELLTQGSGKEMMASLNACLSEFEQMLGKGG